MGSGSRSPGRKVDLLLTEEPDDEAIKHLGDVARGKAGTVVVWTKVDRLLQAYKDPASGHAKKGLEKRAEGLIEHLSEIYQRFLDIKDSRARHVSITVNGKKVTAWDPFQKGYSELVASETMFD